MLQKEQELDTARKIYEKLYDHYTTNKTTWINDALDKKTSYRPIYWIIQRIDDRLTIENHEILPKHTLTHKLTAKLCNQIELDIRQENQNRNNQIQEQKKKDKRNMRKQRFVAKKFVQAVTQSLTSQTPSKNERLT